LPTGAAEKVRVAEPIKAMRVPGWGDATRSQLDKLQDLAKSLGADWFSYIKGAGSEAQSPLAKALGRTVSIHARVRDLKKKYSGES
jgi:aspartyl-tRNA synthetase